MSRELLLKALERMDLARNILTDGKPRPECNWGLLATEDLRAELAQPQAQPAAGWVLVPREPTPAMIASAQIASAKQYDQTIDAALADGPKPDFESSELAIYHAMIAAYD